MLDEQAVEHLIDWWTLWLAAFMNQDYPDRDGSALDRSEGSGLGVRGGRLFIALLMAALLIVAVVGKKYPTALVFAGVGLLQLNTGLPALSAQRARRVEWAGLAFFIPGSIWWIADLIR